MHGWIFLTLVYSTSLFAQSAIDTNEQPKKETKLVRAVDDRAKLIRQRRDLVDVNEQTTVHSEASISND